MSCKPRPPSSPHDRRLCSLFSYPPSQCSARDKCIQSITAPSDDDCILSSLYNSDGRITSGHLRSKQNPLRRIWRSCWSTWTSVIQVTSVEASSCQFCPKARRIIRQERCNCDEGEITYSPSGFQTVYRPNGQYISLNPSDRNSDKTSQMTVVYWNNCCRWAHTSCP